MSLKKVPHYSNSSNFSARFFLVNEYYNASVKGIKNVMGFYNFLPYSMANAGLHGMIRG